MELCKSFDQYVFVFALAAAVNCTASFVNGQSLNGRFASVRVVRGLDSPYRDTEPYVTPDGLTILFTSDRPSDEARVDWTFANIWMATRDTVGDSFDEPVKLELPLGDDSVGFINPTLSENETTLYLFTGSGPGNGDGQIYVARRETTSSPWSRLQPLSENINRPDFDNVAQHVTEDGLTIWFSSVAGNDGNYSMFEASRASTKVAFDKVRPLDNLNSDDHVEISPTVSADGLLLLYESNRDGFGFAELWAATRPSINDEFDDPRSFNELGLGELNADSAAEFAPYLSLDWPADGAKLFFGKAFGEKDWDLYEATWSSSSSPGDVDGNGTIDAGDVEFLAAAIRRNSSTVGFDFDDSGTVDGKDLVHMIQFVIGSWLGDSNLDGEFNSGDLVEVFQAGRYETGIAANWSQGDWNGDGVFDSGDFVNGFQGGGYEQGPRGVVRAVPEPSGVLIVALAGIIIYRRQHAFQGVPPGERRL